MNLAFLIILTARSLILSGNTVQRRLFFPVRFMYGFLLGMGPSRKHLRIGYLVCHDSPTFCFCHAKLFCSVWIVTQLYEMKIHLKRGIRS